MSTTSSLSPEPEELAGRSAFGGFGGDGPPDAAVLAAAGPDAVVALANDASVDALARLVAADGQLVQSRLLRGNQKFIVEVAKAPFDKEDKRRIWAIFKENMSASYRVSSFGWTPKAKQSELFHPQSRYILLRHATPATTPALEATATASTAECVPALRAEELDSTPKAIASSSPGREPASSSDPARRSPPAEVKKEKEQQVSNMLGVPSSSSPPLKTVPLQPSSSETSLGEPSDASAARPTVISTAVAEVKDGKHSSACASESSGSASKAGSSSFIGVPSGLVAPSSLQTPSCPSASAAPRMQTTSASADGRLLSKGKARSLAPFDTTSRRRSARFQPPAASPIAAQGSSQRLPARASGQTTPLAQVKASSRSATMTQTPPARTSARRTSTVDYRETDARTGRPMGSPAAAAPATPRPIASASTPLDAAAAEEEEPYNPYAKRKKLGRPRKASVERRLAYEAAAEAAELKQRAQRRAERQQLAEAAKREEEERKSLSVEGYLMWRFDTEPNEHGIDEPIVYLYELSVASEFQRAGLGRYLVSRLESLGRAWGCRKVILTVLRSNVKAIAFYRKMGYSIDHSSPSRFTWSDSEDEDSTAGEAVDAHPPPVPPAALPAEDDEPRTSVAPASSPVKMDAAGLAEDEPEISGMLWIGGTWRKVKYDYEIMSKTLFDEAEAPTEAVEPASVSTPIKMATKGGPAHDAGLTSRSSAVKERRGHSRRRESASQHPAPATATGPPSAPPYPDVDDRRQSSSTTALPWLEASFALPATYSLSTVPLSMPTLAAVQAVAPAAFASEATLVSSGDNGSKKKRKRLSIVGLLNDAPGSAAVEEAAGGASKGPRLR